MRRCMICAHGSWYSINVRSLVQTHTESFSFCIWLKHLNKTLCQYEPEHCNDSKSVFFWAVTQRIKHWGALLIYLATHLSAKNEVWDFESDPVNVMFFVIITVIRKCILNSENWRMVFLRSSLSSESDITFHNVLIQVNWTIVLKDTETDQFFCFFSLGAVCVCECIFAGPDFLKVFAHMLFLTVSFLHVQSHVSL